MPMAWRVVSGHMAVNELGLEVDTDPILLLSNIYQSCCRDQHEIIDGDKSYGESTLPCSP